MDETGNLVAQSPLEAEIAAHICAPAQAMGYEIVRVRVSGHRGGTLQIMAERPDGTMNVAGCEELSRAVSALLDIEDPLRDEYVLEVSSPGIDRPLTRAKDFSAWAGFDARIDLRRPKEGRKRFRGCLKESKGDLVALETAEGRGAETVVLDFKDITDAKLIMSEALIEESLKRTGNSAC